MLSLILGMLIGSSGFPIINDHQLTPGAVMTTNAEVVCTRSTSTVRNVTMQEKRDVFSAYENKYHLHFGMPHGTYAEVDHLIPLTLGGDNTETNLWPQVWDSPYGSANVGAHTKDRLEVRLHELVCSGKIPLTQAQQEIASDWIQAYKKYVGKFPGQK